MNLIDRILSVFKKQPQAISTNYIHRYTGTSGGAKWNYGLAQSGATKVFDHYETRKNARKAFHDSVQAHTIVKRKTDIIVDRGLICEPNPDIETLNITPEQGEEFRQQVKRYYTLWSTSKKSHRSEINTYNQNQRLAMDCLSRDGEYFIRNYWTNDKDAIIPLQIEFIDPDQIRSDAFTYTSYQPALDDGITRDNRGREKTYKIWHIDRETGAMTPQDIPRLGAISGFQYIIHGFIPDYPGQGRGLPSYTHMLQELENITDLSSSVIKKAINNSNITMYVKPSPDNAASNPFEGVINNQIDGINYNRKPSEVVSQFGASPIPSSTAVNVTTESTVPIDYYPLEADLSTPGSMGVFSLREGEDLIPFSDRSPSESFNAFVESVFTYMCASERIPYEVMLMKFNSNYSASRAALIAAWRYAQIMQNELISDMLQPHYEMLLTMLVANGKVNAPGFNDPLLRAAWLRCNWVGNPMPNIDPEKEARGKVLEVETGFNNIERATQELNGSDAENNIRINKRVYESLKDAIPPWVEWDKAPAPMAQDNNKETVNQ